MGFAWDEELRCEPIKIQLFGKTEQLPKRNLQSKLNIQNMFRTFISLVYSTSEYSLEVLLDRKP